jgi:hypothetical protein
MLWEQKINFRNYFSKKIDKKIFIPAHNQNIFIDKAIYVLLEKIHQYVLFSKEKVDN